MTFLSPQLLWALLLVPALTLGYLALARRRTRYAIRFTNVDLLANIVAESPRWRRWVPPVLFLAALGALLFATARPQLVTKVPRNQASVVLAMDVSGSMRATDVEPTRLEAAETAASALPRAGARKVPGRAHHLLERSAGRGSPDRRPHAGSASAVRARGRRRHCHRRRRCARHRAAARSV